MIFLLITAAVSASTVAPLLLVVVALIGSGGLGYFLDRRSAQASRLANDAVNATTVFQSSLNEERLKRAALEVDLASARQELGTAIASSSANRMLIIKLHERILGLEKELVKGMRDMNEIVRRMFNDEGTDELHDDRWRSAMQALRLSVMQTDREIMVTFVSSECSDVLGYEQSLLVGKSVLTIVDPIDHAIFKRGLREAVVAKGDGRVTEPMSLLMIHKDGTSLPMLLAIGVHEHTITLMLRATIDVKSYEQVV